MQLRTSSCKYTYNLFDEIVNKIRLVYVKQAIISSCRALYRRNDVIAHAHRFGAFGGGENPKYLTIAAVSEARDYLFNKETFCLLAKVKGFSQSRMNPEASKVKRCLFGEPDEEERQSEKERIERELEQETQEKSNHYNFDFKNEKPYDTAAEGARYEWTPVENASQGESQLQGDTASTDNTAEEIQEKSSQKCQTEEKTC